jgi:erythromycin esterase-like protein
MLGWEQRRNTMTHSEFNYLLSSIKALSPEQMRQLRQELATSATAGRPDIAPEELAEQKKPASAPQSILEMVDELRKRVPPEEFAKLPRDGAKQLDHYLYGSPKRTDA